MAHVEFTVEPFVEGHPGPHVAAAIDAARATGADVEVGPFGSSFEVDSADVGAAIGAVTDAAIGHGASHVTVHVARERPTSPRRYEPDGADR